MLFKCINNHLYCCAYRGNGIIVYTVDDNNYYSMQDAANALGITVDELQHIE